MRELTADQELWLRHAQQIGFIGPKPIENVYQHALGFAQVIDELLRVDLLPPSFCSADLGSGAGVPGIFLAHWFPDSRFVLVDSMVKRYKFLAEMVVELKLQDRVSVYGGRSEEFSIGNASSFDLVTARGFASPSATAENASGILRKGGILLVSEPPESTGDRWPADGLASFGFSPIELFKVDFSFCWMIKDSIVRGKYPRQVGIPEKDPLF